MLDENPKARPISEEVITRLNIYSLDVFKTNDKEVQMTLMKHDYNCGCKIPWYFCSHTLDGHIVNMATP